VSGLPAVAVHVDRTIESRIQIDYHKISSALQYNGSQSSVIKALFIVKVFCCFYLSAKTLRGYDLVANLVRASSSCPIRQIQGAYLTCRFGLLNPHCPSKGSRASY
jgi:hypothetical protein